MRIALAVAGVAAFLAFSAVLARVLAAASAARGEAIAAVERRAGSDRVRILRVDGVSGLALTGGTDVARVAWREGDRLPVVQCVRVRRQGDPVSGYDVEVEHVSRAIGREEDCPR